MVRKKIWHSRKPKCLLTGIVNRLRSKPLLPFIILCQLLLIVVPAASEIITMGKCVDMALQNNPDLQKQQLNLELADADMAERQSRNFGQLNFVSSYAHYNLPRTMAPMTPASITSGAAGVPTTENLFTSGLVYEVELFTGFAQTRAVEIAVLQKEMAGAILKLNREQLIYNVKVHYVNILSLQAQDEAQTAYIGALQHIYDNMASEVQLGRKARIDQLKAAADLKNAEAEKDQVRAHIAIMRASLANLMGVVDIPELQSVDISPESIVVVDNKFTAQLAGLERLRAARLSVVKNRKIVQKTGSALYPQVVLNAAYGQNFAPNDSSHQNSGDWEDQEVWQAGLNLKWNIFDFGSNRALVQKARIAERQSRYEESRVELELKRALIEATTKINSFVSDYKSARVELSMTRETENIEQVRFEHGAVDINDLLYAKARNRISESRLIDAAYNYKTARFYLDYLLENGENR